MENISKYRLQNIINGAEIELSYMNEGDFDEDRIYELFENILDNAFSILKSEGVSYYEDDNGETRVVVD